MITVADLKEEELAGSALDMLIDCLTRIDGVLADLTVACEEQMLALRDNDGPAIEKAVAHVNEFLAGMDEMEKERSRIKQSLDEQLELSADSSLAELISRVSAARGAKLNELLGKLRLQADRLREINRINGIMTKRALTVNQLLREALSPTEGVTYGDGGGFGRGVAKRSLINKTI